MFFFYNNIVIIQYYGLLYLFKMIWRGCCKCWNPPRQCSCTDRTISFTSGGDGGVATYTDFLRGLLRWPTPRQSIFYILLLLFYLFTVAGGVGVCSTVRHLILYYNVIYYNRGARPFFFFSHANGFPFMYDIIINSNVMDKLKQQQQQQTEKIKH